MDAGVRFDHSRAINPDLPVVSADGRETDAVISGVGTLYTQNVVSPRLGLTAQLDRSGPHRCCAPATDASIKGVLTGELDPISQGSRPTTTMAYEAATGGYTRLVSVVDPKIDHSLDPETRTPHTDEFSLAIDREIATGLRASAAYIRKRGRDFIGWIDTTGQYRTDTLTVNGRRLPVFVLTNTPSDRRFVLTNPDTLFADYDGLVVALEKRRSNSWSRIGFVHLSPARTVSR